MEHVEFTTGVLYPFINFSIFIGLAIYFFRGPITKMLTGRREEFQKLMAEAASAKREAEEKLEVINERLANLDSEIDGIKNKSVEQAKYESEKIIDEANRLAEHLKKEAKSISEAELIRAKHELQKEIMDIVKDKVVGRISQELTKDRQVEIVNQKSTSIQNI